MAGAADGKPCAVSQHRDLRVSVLLDAGEALLGDFLRRSLTLGSRDRVPFSEELALAEDLLAIEKVRFGERLRLERRIEEAACGCLVPPLLLQPLVENAVTHGIAQCLDGGTVRIEAQRSAGRLLVAIDNPRDPEGPARKGTGIGLQNVVRRLHALYGREAELRLRAEGGFFRVELELAGRAVECVGRRERREAGAIPIAANAAFRARRKTRCLRSAGGQACADSGSGSGRGVRLAAGACSGVPRSMGSAGRLRARGLGGAAP